MTSTTSLFDRTLCIALLVAHAHGKTMLSPFFAKCEGILVIDPRATKHGFLANTERTKQSICDLILKSGVTRLVCGFISEPERDKLSAAGIDVRLGSCVCPVHDLAASFEMLPMAYPETTGALRRS
jgi:predicted Fe-Mo cluster-binding NifX family protein